MASSWRMGVWLNGVNDGYRYLAARGLGGLSDHLFIATTKYPGYFEDLVYVGGDLGWIAGPPLPIPAAHPHFPYGKPVEPD